MEDLEFKLTVTLAYESLKLLFEHALREHYYDYECYELFKAEAFDIIETIDNQKTTWKNFWYKFIMKRKTQALFIKIFDTPTQI